MASEFISPNIGTFEPKYYPTSETTTSKSNYTQRTTPSTSYQTTTATPTMKKPVLGELPAYDMPEYDEDRVMSLRELSMSVPMSRLQRALNRTLIESRYMGNSAVRNEAYRKALAGYGEGLGAIGSEARREAITQYEPEYAAQREKAGAEYQAGLGKYMAQFNADLNEYLNTMKRTSSTSSSSTQYVPTGTTQTSTRNYSLSPTGESGNTGNTGTGYSNWSYNPKPIDFSVINPALKGAVYDSESDYAAGKTSR